MFEWNGKKKKIKKKDEEIIVVWANGTLKIKSGPQELTETVTPWECWVPNQFNSNEGLAQCHCWKIISILCAGDLLLRKLNVRARVGGSSDMTICRSPLSPRSYSLIKNSDWFRRKKDLSSDCRCFGNLLASLPALGWRDPARRFKAFKQTRIHLPSGPSSVRPSARTACLPIACLSSPPFPPLPLFNLRLPRKQKLRQKCHVHMSEVSVKSCNKRRRQLQHRSTLFKMVFYFNKKTESVV